MINENPLHQNSVQSLIAFQGKKDMSDQAAFEDTLASLHDAMLYDTRWPATSALIDEACGLTGNAILTGEGPKEDILVSFVGLYYRGQRRTDLEREYIEVYHPIDERVPRFRQLPESRLAHVKDMYTAEELKTSPVYNEAMFRAKFQSGLNVRLGGLDGSYMSWALGDPVSRQGWESSQLTMIKRLLPHIRQFICIRQILGRAKALEATMTTLLENRRIGIIHLDRRGRILAANDRARRILLHGDVLSDRGGVLHASAPGGRSHLYRLVAAALPTAGEVAVSGTVSLRRSIGLPPLVIHVKPMGAPQTDYGERRAAALVLLVEPEYRHRIDSGLVAEALSLTPGESQVAAWLAEGRSVDEIARTTGRTNNTIYWYLKQIYQKLHISRQVELVRLVLSVTELK